MKGSYILPGAFSFRILFSLQRTLVSSSIERNFSTRRTKSHFSIVWESLFSSSLALTLACVLKHKSWVDSLFNQGFIHPTYLYLLYKGLAWKLNTLSRQQTSYWANISMTFLRCIEGWPVLSLKYLIMSSGTPSLSLSWKHLGWGSLTGDLISWKATGKKFSGLAKWEEAVPRS